MNTQLATTQIRLANWANIIHARNESGLSINEYCRQNGLSKGAYFYWLRKLRSAALESSGTRFVEVQSPVPEICVDPSAGSVTVEVGNAYKFTPEGGNVKLAIAETEASDTAHARFEIRVEDSGIGMSEEFTKRIGNRADDFDPGRFSDRHRRKRPDRRGKGICGRGGRPGAVRLRESAAFLSGNGKLPVMGQPSDAK